MVYFLFRRRTSFLFIAPVIMLLVGKPTLKLLLIGLPLVAIGEAIRIWSAGYLNKMDVLTTAGPFALCRNPLYVGSLFISLGYFTMSNEWYVWACGLVLFILFHGGAVKYEEQMLRDKFGEPFVKYCQIVPRFIPRPRRMAGFGQFTVKQLMANHEYKGIIGAAIICALFAARAYTGFYPIGWIKSLF